VTDKEVFEDNYGGESLINPAGKRVTSAIYIRESNINEILSPVTLEDIPEHLRMYMLI